MSKIQITCDRCGCKIVLSVRQAHEARAILEKINWGSRDTSGPTGAKKEDYCPDCNNGEPA